MEGLTFTDVTAQSGIEFRHTFGDRHLSNIVESTGSGPALLDYDGDGDMDLYLVNGTFVAGLNDPKDPAAEAARRATNRLYRNDGGLRFTDVTARAGVGHGGYGMSAAVGDYDNDGDPDLYVTNYGPNVLYRNNGDGTFSDVTEAAGVAGPEKMGGFTKFSANAVFFDQDRDGDLDLFVCNYLAFDPEYRSYYLPEGFPGPKSYLGQDSQLFRNNGNGTFTDVLPEFGLKMSLAGRCMGASVADFDGDGTLEIFQANDAMENYLFQMGTDGKYREVAVRAGVAYNQGGEATASMHGSVGDLDGDGRLDLYVPDLNFGGLFLNGGSMAFSDRAIEAGIAQAHGQFSGWGASLADLDNDGDLDIFQVNGKAHHLFGEQPQVFANDGKGHFADVSLALGEPFTVKHTSRGLVVSDLDNDGDLDAFFVNIDEEGVPTLLRNDSPAGKAHWLSLRLVGTRSARDPVGALVTVKAGGRTLVAQHNPSTGYLSSGDPRIHFGLGAATVAEEVEIRWPLGALQKVRNVPVDRVVRIQEAEGEMDFSALPAKQG